MNDRRLKRVRDELAALVEDRRRERARNQPCETCGRPLAESIRLVEQGESACTVCEDRAAATGTEIITMWPPRGIDEDEAR